MRFEAISREEHYYVAPDNLIRITVMNLIPEGRWYVTQETFDSLTGCYMTARSVHHQGYGSRTEALRVAKQEWDFLTELAQMRVDAARW